MESINEHAYDGRFETAAPGYGIAMLAVRRAHASLGLVA